MRGNAARRVPPAVVVALVAVAAAALYSWAFDHRPPAIDATRAPRVTTIGVQGVPLSTAGLLLPNRSDSLRIAVLGDVGHGTPAQYETAAELSRWYDVFAFEIALLLGDNNYGTAAPEEYVRRFEAPYDDLLEAGVRFQAVLGNHDPPGQTDYPPFHMDGRRYYRFTRPVEAALLRPPATAEFFALDTISLDRAQLEWLSSALAESEADWKVAFYHYPLYTSARYTARAASMRRQLEDLFVAGGVDVGLSGHEHVYERLEPQRGVFYLTSGAAGDVRVDDVKPGANTAASFDDDTHFVLLEFTPDAMFFQAVSRTGVTVDAGRLEKG